MSFSFAIVGGGWYGCHIATSLQALGFPVTLFEARARLLDAASGNNQFRLHLGFHYPRHYATRKQSREGFSRFMERYPTLRRAVPRNIYAVAQRQSLVDFLTYKLIMTASGIEFVEIEPQPGLLCEIEGCLMVPEQVLLLDRARAHFAARLGASAVLGHEVQRVEETPDGVRVDGARFDFLIDASWGHFRRPPIKLHYEPTLLLYYEARQQFPAITLVDGPLASIYPTEDPELFTLSSVPHTPLGQYRAAAQARAALDSLGQDVVNAKRDAMEAQIRRFVPAFDDVFRFVGPQLSIKTKPDGAFDDRSCYVFRDGRVFSVMSGKIDTVFFAVERILSLLEAIPEGPGQALTGNGTLRAEAAGLARWTR